MVTDPMVLLKKCARFKLRVLFSKDRGYYGGTLSAEEIAVQWGRKADSECAEESSDGADSDALDLRDRTKNACSLKLKEKVDAALKDVPKRGITSEEGPEVLHFRAFLEAHNAHVRALQSLFEEPDDLSKSMLAAGYLPGLFLTKQAFP
jgi:hypothetical protein